MIEEFYPTGGLLVLIAAFGIWVSRTGKPYNGLLFNIHKLIALGAVILTAIRIFRLDPIETFPSLALLLLGLAVLGTAVLFVTGAVLSIQSEVKPIFQWVHGISLVITAGALFGGLIIINAVN